MNAKDEKLLQEIEAREQKATPGPWATGFRDVVGDWGGVAYQRIVLPNGDVWERQHSDGVCSEGHTYLDDSNFIAHVRTDIPTLIKLVRQLTVENAVSLDRQYLAGAQQGYILGELGDREGHNSLVAGRMKEIHAALPAPPEKGDIA